MTINMPNGLLIHCSMCGPQGTLCCNFIPYPLHIPTWASITSSHFPAHLPVRTHHVEICSWWLVTIVHPLRKSVDRLLAQSNMCTRLCACVCVCTRLCVCMCNGIVLNLSHQCSRVTSLAHTRTHIVAVS